MTERAPLPPRLSSGPFTRREALTLGVTASRMRAGDLDRPFHGVRAPGGPPVTVEQRCRAYRKRMNPQFVFSSITAAQLYGLPLPLYALRDTRLHVGSLSPATPPKGAGVIGHSLSPQVWATRELVLHDYEAGDMFVLPVAVPELVWAQLACLLDRADLVAVGDALIGGDEPACGIDELRSAAQAWVGRRGSKAMASAVGQVRRGSLSRPESLLRVHLAEAGFPEPALNAVVCDALGRPLHMADLNWPQFRVLIEYEGDGHRTSRAKFRSDITRGEEYADGEWFSMRATADDVFVNPHPLMARLARRLQAQGWKPLREIARIAGARR